MSAASPEGSAGGHRSEAALAAGQCVAVTVFALAYALAGRERGFGRIAALLIPLELAADTVFTTGQHVCYGRAGGPVAGPLPRSAGTCCAATGRRSAPRWRRMTGTGAGPARRSARPRRPGHRLAAARRARLRRPARRRLAAPRRAGTGPAAARGHREHLPPAAAGRRRGDVRRAPAARRLPRRRAPHGHRPRPAPRALPGTAWPAVPGRRGLSRPGSAEHDPAPDSSPCTTPTKLPRTHGCASLWRTP